VIWTWINREWFKPSVITLKSADGRHFKTAGPERSDDQDFGWNARQSEAIQKRASRKFAGLVTKSPSVVSEATAEREVSSQGSLQPPFKSVPESPIPGAPALLKIHLLSCLVWEPDSCAEIYTFTYTA
jgi:hypothetical protein